LILVAVPAAATPDAELRITHTPHPCLLAGRLATIEAHVEPGGDGLRVKVHFRKEGETPFYSVEMRRDGDSWLGVLPSPASGTSRISYFITAAADGSRARVPASAAFVVDVADAPCAEGAFPVSAEGPREVGVPRGAPRTPPGFEAGGIGAFVEDAGEELPAAAPSRVAAGLPLAVVPIVSGARVRAVISPGDRRRQGRLVSVDGEALVLDSGKDRVRIPRSDLVSLEVREKGSSGMRALGGLAGSVAGLVVTALFCESIASCDSIAIAWAGVGVGAAAGVAVTGGGSWKPVMLARAGPVALDLRVRRADAAVELRVGF
jgi:hypothetical protein